MLFRRLVAALVDAEIRGQFLYMPNQVQQEENKQAVFVKYKLPNVIGGREDTIHKHRCQFVLLRQIRFLCTLQLQYLQ
jgi:hypothetical protein